MPPPPTPAQVPASVAAKSAIAVGHGSKPKLDLPDCSLFRHPCREFSNPSFDKPHLQGSLCNRTSPLPYSAPSHLVSWCGARLLSCSACCGVLWFWWLCSWLWSCDGLFGWGLLALVSLAAALSTYAKRQDASLAHLGMDNAHIHLEADAVLATAKERTVSERRPATRADTAKDKGTEAPPFPQPKHWKTRYKKRIAERVLVLEAAARQGRVLVWPPTAHAE